jgi:hypothetical protein
MANRLCTTLALCLMLPGTNGFIIHSHRLTPAKHHRFRKSSTFEMYLDSIDSLHLSPIIWQSSIFSTTSQLASDPVFEAEVLTDFSHVVLDFTTFVSPNTAWIRFFNVLGRILIITADYVQDQYISPDEAIFQSFMLIISTYMFLKSAGPVVMAASSNKSLSVRDRRAFSQLFSEVDMTVLQFKTLLTSQTLEWVELEPNQKVSLESCMYWLHSGDISSSLRQQSTSTKLFGSLRLSDRLFGDVLLAKALEESMLKKRTKSHRTKPDDPSSALKETLIAGPNGATLLRLSTPKLLKAMNHDDQLSDSINRLILLCMQEKLTQTFQRGLWKKSNVINSQELCK